MPAQYEWNGRFWHLVHVLGQMASGMSLPSFGLELNDAKSESHLDKQLSNWIILFRSQFQFMTSINVPVEWNNFGKRLFFKQLINIKINLNFKCNTFTHIGIWLIFTLLPTIQWLNIFKKWHFQVFHSKPFKRSKAKYNLAH